MCGLAAFRAGDHPRIVRVFDAEAAIAKELGIVDCRCAAEGVCADVIDLEALGLISASLAIDDAVAGGALDDGDADSAGEFASHWKHSADLMVPGLITNVYDPPHDVEPRPS